MQVFVLHKKPWIIWFLLKNVWLTATLLVLFDITLQRLHCFCNAEVENYFQQYPTPVKRRFEPGGGGRLSIINSIITHTVRRAHFPSDGMCYYSLCYGEIPLIVTPLTFFSNLDKVTTGSPRVIWGMRCKQKVWISSRGC